MSGRPGPDPDVTDRELLETLLYASKPVLGTAEIAERVDMARQNVSRRMQRLESEMLVHTDTVGRVRVWWLSDGGREFLESDAQFSNQ